MNGRYCDVVHTSLIILDYFNYLSHKIISFLHSHFLAFQAPQDLSLLMHLSLFPPYSLLTSSSSVSVFITIQVNQEDLLELLGKAVTCAVLGKAGPQRSRVLGLLYKASTHQPSK